MTMIELLLPTRFPVIRDIHESLDFINNKHSTRPLWFNPFKTHYFSYLKIGGTTYTVKKNIWLNDILNHPVYRKMIVEYRKLHNWRDEQISNKYNKYENAKKTRKEIIKKINELFEGFDKVLDNIDTASNTNINYVMVTKAFTENITKYKYFRTTYTNLHADDTLIADKVGVYIEDTKTMARELGKYNEKHNIFTKPHIKKKLPKSNMTVLNKEYRERINNFIDELTPFIEELESVNSKIVKGENLFQRQLGEDTDIMIRKFKAFMNEFSDPFRKSSNIELQHLIDSVNGREGKTDTGATKFYSTLDSIYTQYVKGGTPTDTTKLLSYMDVGISYINIGDDDTKPTKEVYFMVDLIEGEVNDDNVSSIYCPYIGDYLGNQLEYLLKEVRVSRKNKWAVDTNRQMFSLKNIKSSITNNFSNKELVSKYITPSTKIGPQQLDTKIQEVDPIQNFKSYIMTPDLVSKLDSNIKSLQNTYIEDKNVMLLNSNNILDMIRNMDSNPIAKELFSTIKLWNVNKNVHNLSVTKKLNSIKGNISARNKDIADELEHPSMVYDSAKQKERLLKKERGMNNILETILDSVLAHENTKQKKMKGGTRKKKHSIHKQTKRIGRI